MPPDAEAWIHEKLARRLEGYRYDRITVHPVTHLDMVRYYAQVQDEVIRGG